MRKVLWLWMAMTSVACGFWSFAYVQPVGMGGWNYAILGIIGFGLAAICLSEWQEMKP
jgi:hypothetical protein